MPRVLKTGPFRFRIYATMPLSRFSRIVQVGCMKPHRTSVLRTTMRAPVRLKPQEIAGDRRRLQEIPQEN